MASSSRQIYGVLSGDKMRKPKPGWKTGRNQKQYFTIKVPIIECDTVYRVLTLMIFCAQKDGPKILVPLIGRKIFPLSV